ncbi:type I-E CRISPR-associated protein Cse2/CasB [Oceanicella actignis]|uniref:CRISPR system Cascade subunit CasB n=1 Tax=Oceanicella actignis TaxID=1189325 RepID=A0A1M7U3P3_9RHOB|nr:type I-E CRISPR-associated protein Cse2/CasB [Oceanicella actignis]SET87538.1 CRISPR system Cascade subunit CasB [Oceanicella actignis]SHN77651.1 CRISPR system Cascade subunit CasB [Oceanicella actignis]
MSETESGKQPTRGERAAAWWRERLANRDSGAARGLSARLRRAHALAALAEPQVQALARDLGLGEGQADTLLRLVWALAELRESDGHSLARRLGGPEPVMSHLRFQRLMRAEGEEFSTALRRAIVMADRRCDVARLAADLLVWDHPQWGEAARRRWIFDYFAAPAPGTQETSGEIAQ